MTKIAISDNSVRKLHFANPSALRVPTPNPQPDSPSSYAVPSYYQMVSIVRSPVKNETPHPISSSPLPPLPLHQKDQKKSQTHHPLPHKKPHSKRLRLERNFAALREIKHIPLPPLHDLARLITNLKLAIHNDLHLMIRILIH
jgi:hypothetical protein